MRSLKFNFLAISRSRPRCTKVLKVERHRSIPPSCWYGILLICYAMMASVQCQWLEGIAESCDTEGEKMELSLIKDNPCITCRCKNGSIQCFQEKCPLRYECSYLKNEKEKCCKTCITCLHQGKVKEFKAAWKEANSNGMCLNHVCQDGVITREPISCHVDRKCKDPIAPPPGYCGCQKCRGCMYNREKIEEGRIFRPQEDKCIECTCKNGESECNRRICPVLVCEKRNQQLDTDGCCMTCTGQRLLYDLRGGACWFRRGSLENSETVVIDKCTSCTCQNGTIVCDRELCETSLDCPPNEWIHDECCPRCPTINPLNCLDENGNTIQHGETWKESRDPCLECSCQNGEITCERTICPSSNKACPDGQIMDKIPGSCCHECTAEPGICSVFGDPHYRTFDGRPFNFQGDCKYMLAKDCLEKNFTVVVENNAKRSPQFSWTNTVHLTLFNTVPQEKILVSLYQRLVVKINSVKVSLPFVSMAVLVWVEQHIIKVRTNAGVSLNWDGDSFLEVGASSQHRGTLCGLCGNFNGFPRDDFIGGDGSFKFNKDEFANSWKIGGDSQCSRRKLKTRSPNACSKNLKLKVAARKSCLIFKSKDFQTCYSLVDPVEYFRSCLTDMCECSRNRKCSCESIRAYTAACARRGVTITWNEKNHCKQTCSRGKVYSTCGSPCSVNCRNFRRLRRRGVCRRHCTAGCFCPAGYVTEGKKCIKISKCKAFRFRQLKKKVKNINPFKRFLKSAETKKIGKRARQRHVHTRFT